MITMPAFNSRGVQTAVLGFPVDLVSFQDYLTSKEPLPSNSAFTVIDNNGNIIIDTLNKGNIGKPFKNASIISEIGKNSEGSLVNIDPSGIKRFYSYATVEITGWKLLMGIPVNDVYVEANHAAVKHLIFFSIICGAGILFSLIYSGKIGNKVQLLINGFNEISSGNLDCKIKISGKDEFAFAGQAFNRMIAERKFAEEEIKSLAASLEKRVAERTAELMNAKSELEAFSYAVSHDLQAPARHVLAFSEILLKDHADELTEESLHNLKRIRKAGENMRDMITHLLALSRLNRAEMNRTHADLSYLCATIISELEESEPDRDVKISIEDGLFIDADPVLLELAIRNLLENAWKYTGKSAEPLIEVGQTVKDDMKCFFIKDNGCGFDMAYYEKLFVPFQRLHPDKEYEGSGVGLSTVLRIVQRHGGFITAQSAPGEGAVFYFTMSKEAPPAPQENL
jgi:signal transduction histidine kinase